MNDKQLVTLAKSGCRDAFEAIYSRHYSNTVRLLVKKCGNLHDAEDLAQDTFIQVFRKIHGFRGEASLSTWIYRVAFNVFLMKVRATRKERAGNAGSLDDIETDSGQDLRDTCGRDDTRLVQTVDRLVLNEAVDKLSPGYKAVVKLHCFDGMEHTEVARRCGITVGTVKSQFNKSKKILRKMIVRGPKNVAERKTSRPQRRTKVHVERITLLSPQGKSALRIV